MMRIIIEELNLKNIDFEVLPLTSFVYKLVIAESELIIKFRPRLANNNLSALRELITKIFRYNLELEIYKNYNKVSDLINIPKVYLIRKDFFVIESISEHKLFNQLNSSELVYNQLRKLIFDLNEYKYNRIFISKFKSLKMRLRGWLLELLIFVKVFFVGGSINTITFYNTFNSPVSLIGIIHRDLSYYENHIFDSSRWYLIDLGSLVIVRSLLYVDIVALYFDVENLTIYSSRILEYIKQNNQLCEILMDNNTRMMVIVAIIYQLLGNHESLKKQQLYVSLIIKEKLIKNYVSFWEIFCSSEFIKL